MRGAIEVISCAKNRSMTLLIDIVGSYEQFVYKVPQAACSWSAMLCRGAVASERQVVGLGASEAALAQSANDSQASPMCLNSAADSIRRVSLVIVAASVRKR